MSKPRRLHPFAGRLTRWLMFALLLTIGGISYLVYSFASSVASSLECNRNQNMLDTVNERINNVLNIIEVAATNNQPLIEQTVGNASALETSMKRMLVSNPHVKGVSIAFVENYFPQKGRWYELYASRDSSHVNIKKIGSASHDYLQAKWFTECVKNDKGYWSDTYYDDAGAKEILTTYSLPIHDSQGRVIGVMGTDISLSWLQEQMKEMEDKNLHYSLLTNNDTIADYQREIFLSHSFIIQQDGTYIVHHDKNRILNDNFYKYVESTADTLDDIIARDIKNNERGFVVDAKGHIAQIDFEGRDYYVFYAPIEHVGWITVITVPTLAIDLVGYLVGGILVFVMIIGIIAAILVCHFIVRNATKPLKRLAQSTEEIAQGNFHVELPTIRKHDEIRLLRDSFENMQQSLARYVDELKATTASKASIESELRIAHDIQMTMLPKTFPPFPERHDIDIYGELIPAKQVGGDLFDFCLRDEQLFFCVGDVSGKGIPASLVMAVTRSLFRNVLNHTDSPDKIVEALNEAIAENNDSNMFVTMFVGVLNLKTGLLRYCNAGHDAPLLIGQGVGSLFCDANLPIGIMPGFNFTVQESVIERNTTIFIFTDGLNEAEDISHAQFGNDRITTLAQSLLNKQCHQPETLIREMLSAVHQFVGEAEQSDDLTMLAIQLKAVSKQEQSDAFSSIMK